ncbi:MAG: hypothetical protein VCB42_00360, partial [Myxococcota bacterium]
MRRTLFGMIGSLVLAIWSPIGAVAEDSAMPEVQPPIGVFGSMIHARGDVLLSYRFQREDYEGLLLGTQSISTAQAATEYGYTVIPTALRVSRHIFEARWAPVEEFTVVVALPYYEKELDWQLVPDGPSMTTTVKGFGDMSLNFLYRVFEDARGRV